MKFYCARGYFQNTPVLYKSVSVSAIVDTCGTLNILALNSVIFNIGKKIVLDLFAQMWTTIQCFIPEIFRVLAVGKWVQMGVSLALYNLSFSQNICFQRHICYMLNTRLVC